MVTTAAANVSGLKDGASDGTYGLGAMVAVSVTADVNAVGLFMKGILSFSGSTICHGSIGLALADRLCTTLATW